MQTLNLNMNKPGWGKRLLLSFMNTIDLNLAVPYRRANIAKWEDSPGQIF